MKTAQGKVNQLKASLPENYQEYLILRHAKTILCRRHEADLQTLGSLKAWLEGQQTFAAMYGEAKAIIEKLRHIIENEKSVVLKAKTMDEHQALLPKEEETLQNCKKEEQQLAELLAPLLKELTQLEKTREDMHPQGLHDDYNRLNQAILDNDKASATLQLLETVRLQHADAEKEYKALLDEHERLEHNAKNLDENLQTAQRQYDIAKDIYDKWHRSLDDSFKMLRASLRKGDTCPLCMNEVTHDHVPDPDFESVIRPVVEQRDAADKVLKEALASQQTNNKLIVDAERKMPLAKRKWERSLNDLEKQHADTVDVL